MRIRISTAVLVSFSTAMLWFTACSEPTAPGTTAGLSGGERPADDNDPTTATGSETPGADQEGYYPEGWGGLRQDEEVDYGADSTNLYVPATIYYGGEYSGDDALYKFFLQRVDPAPERIMRLITEAKGYKKSDTRVIDRVCRCGKNAKFRFFWEHHSLRRGALHASYYDADPKLQGDWIVDNFVNDSSWYKGTVAKAKQGFSTLFLGADTENPAAFTGINSVGFGYLRTWYYMPNSPFGTQEHRWDSRDDMRIAISCNIEACPDSTAAGTQISVEHHFSHASSWRLPANK